MNPSKLNLIMKLKLFLTDEGDIVGSADGDNDGEAEEGDRVFEAEGDSVPMIVGGCLFF